MKTTCFKGSLALLLLLAAGTLADAKWAAIAYSPKTGKWGASYNCQDLASAQNLALDACTTTDARIAVWVQNGWVALAKAPNGAYGWAWSGTSRADAESRAMQAAGPDATILTWQHSGD